MDPLLLEVVQSVDDFDLTSPHAVKTSNTDLISFAENGQAITELVSLLQRCRARNLLKEDLFASICFEVFHL